ncbi:MAG: tetratricopeptide repeat protein [Longimicrobiales bacterium]|nr:tetratricopeptide repeat protein [Longimicrobiales bacterium]
MTLASVTVWLTATGRVGLPDWKADFPPPPEGGSASTSVAFADFVGAERCKECHEKEHEAWRGSTHGKAGGIPANGVVIAPFDGTPIRFADATVIPEVGPDGIYQFTVTGEGRDPQVLRVSGAVGGGHMVGGGTQGFVSDFPDGTVRFLPFDFIKAEGVWFCNTNTRTDEGWIPITPDMFLGECADWPPLRILGTDERYGNCQECHSALTELIFDRTANRFSTRVLGFAIECESCHGPMSLHVQRSDSTRISSETDLAVLAFATLTEDESLSVCFRCHALKDVMRPGYLPGMPLQDYYSLGLPMLDGEPLFPDGRVRTFAYQENHRYSDCYLSGSMTCVDCHDPHSQRYRNIWGQALEGRFSDGQCTDCHPSKADRPEEHTFHEPGTPGSACVDCHMPYLQHPDLGSKLRFARSDHTIPIPRPGTDDAMGIVNACAQAQCHQDSSVEELQDQTRAWYGEIKPRKPIVEALSNPFQLGDMRRGMDALLDPDAGNVVAQVQAIGLFVSRYLSPDMTALDADVEGALFRLASSEDLDVRSVSLAALHLARGEDRRTRALLIRTLRNAGELDSALRSRWAMALATFADRYFRTQEWSPAMALYRKVLEIRPDDAATLRNLGLAQAYAGDFGEAVVTLRRSVVADPRDPLTWVNLGLSLDGVGDAPGAEDAYREAVAVAGDEPLAHFNLGNALLRRGDPAGAIRQYERALELQPTLTNAYLYLARAYGGMQDTAQVLRTARRWRRFAPGDPQPGQLVEELEKALGAR